MPIGGAQLRTLSASGFSQLFVKKTLKGKGIFSRSSEASREFGSAVAGQKDEKLGCVTKVALDSLLKSGATNDLLLSHGVNRPDHESFGDAICLRVWLEPGSQKREKVESMHIFRQTVELADSAQTQGLALQDLRSSYLYLWPLNSVIYTGSFVKGELESVVNQVLNKKGPLEQHMQAHFGSGVKLQKLIDDTKYLTHQPRFTSSCSSRIKKLNEIYFNVMQDCGYFDVHTQNHSSYQSTSATTKQQSFFATAKLEEKRYSSP